MQLKAPETFRGFFIPQLMPVYIIHLDKKIHKSSHYIGFCEGNPEDRLKMHRSGRGAKFLAAANEYGISYNIVRVWPEGDRNFERKLKNGRNHCYHCPVCREAKKKYLSDWHKAKRKAKKNAG